MLHEKLRGAKSDGGMSIVGAGMHHTRRKRGKSLVKGNVPARGALAHTQRINIKAQRDRWPLAAAQQRNHPGKSPCGLGEIELIRAGFLRPAVMLAQRFLVRHAHARRVKAHIAAQQQLLIAHILQFPRNAGGRAHFQPAGFGKAVKFPPQRG